MIHTFEDMEFSRMQAATRTPALLEGYSGVKIVQWAGQIERQMQQMLKEQETANNWPYADKIRKYLEIWRSNEITGSLNRETLEVLQSPLELMAVDDWSMANYFSNLRDRLRTLIASEEELPRDMEMGEEPMPGGPGGRGAPPLNPSFGPEDEAPPGGDATGAPPPEDELPAAGDLEPQEPDLTKKPNPMPPV